MIPLIWFLIAWLVLVAIFSVLALVSITVYTRFGLESFGTHALNAIFLIVAVLVILGTAGYLFTVDWSQTFNVIPSSTPSLGI